MTSLSCTRSNEFLGHHMPEATEEEVSQAARQASFYIPE